MIEPVSGMHVALLSRQTPMMETGSQSSGLGQLVATETGLSVPHSSGAGCWVAVMTSSAQSSTDKPEGVSCSGPSRWGPAVGVGPSRAECFARGCSCSGARPVSLHTFWHRPESFCRVSFMEIRSWFLSCRSFCFSLFCKASGINHKK